MKRRAPVFWIMIVLAFFGLVNIIFFSNALAIINLLIPIAVFAIVLLLYKYFSKRRAKQPKIKPSARTMQKIGAAKARQPAKKRKHYPFQVIEGSKGKNDDQQPKYH